MNADTPVCPNSVKNSKTVFYIKGVFPGKLLCEDFSCEYLAGKYNYCAEGNSFGICNYPNSIENLIKDEIANTSIDSNAD